MGTSLTDGDCVNLAARVYNYSLNQGTGIFRVAFARVSYDPATGRQGTDRTTIGYAEGVQLAPMEMKEVLVEWNTSGLGGATADDKKEYVIYVTVDPEGAVKDDLHPLNRNGKEFVGGNNEGYWPWDSGIAVFGNPPKTQLATSAMRAKEPDVSLDDRSLALDTGKGLAVEDGAKVTAGKTGRLQVRIVSDQSDRGYRFVHFRDNGRLFATKLVFGVAKGSTFIWSDWTPENAGAHRLTAEVMENRDDAKPGNNVDALQVVVTAAEPAAM
jgi:hypothetical protein